MASWPENPRLINTRIPRLDGLAKASGKAKYPSDVRPEGTLFGVMLYSPYAHAKVKSIDISAAEKMPGVKAVIAIAKAGTTLRYHGDDIAAVAAETEEQARDAVRAIKVEYEVLASRRHRGAVDGRGSARGLQAAATSSKGRGQTKGKPEEAMAAAEVTIEGTYSVPLITHVCLESHGLTVKWEGRQDGNDKAVAWASTQNVTGVANDLGGSSTRSRRRTSPSTPITWGVASARSSAPISGAERRPSSRRRPAAGRSRCSSTVSRSTWRRAIVPAAGPTSRWGRTATARSSP